MANAEKMAAKRKMLSTDRLFSIRYPARYAWAVSLPTQAHSNPPKPTPIAIQTALQAAASRGDTSRARRCRTNKSRASIAITKARNTAHAHSGAVNAGLRPAARPRASAWRFRLRQQSRLAEHGAGAVDRALARDQVVVSRDQLAH